MRRPVALAVLCRANIVRRRVIRSRSLFVTETGRPEFDTLTVEHNGFVVDQNCAPEAVLCGLSCLLEHGASWDELVISGVDSTLTSTYAHAAQTRRLIAAVSYEKPFYVARLEAFRKAGGDFLATLSGNTRSQVRRSLREYSSAGAPAFRVAQTLPDAERMFARLRTIHQEHWTRKGHAGAFGSGFAQAFHADLIRSRFQSGEIQIGEVRAGERELGYLYNFVFDGVVSNYQSAFVYGEQERHSPGLVSHCCAIQQNFERGLRCYDMLAGSQRYKQSLATDEGTMAWLALQRPRLRFTLERFAKRAWDVVRRRRLQ